jgi:hypothetical protein
LAGLHFPQAWRRTIVASTITALSHKATDQKAGGGSCARRKKGQARSLRRISSASGQPCVCYRTAFGRKSRVLTLNWGLHSRKGRANVGTAAPASDNNTTTAGTTTAPGAAPAPAPAPALASGTSELSRGGLDGGYKRGLTAAESTPAAPAPGTNELSRGGLDGGFKRGLTAAESTPAAPAPAPGTVQLNARGTGWMSATNEVRPQHLSAAPVAAEAEAAASSTTGRARDGLDVGYERGPATSSNCCTGGSSRSSSSSSIWYILNA